jgi:hydrogenase maturation protease
MTSGIVVVGLGNSYRRDDGVGVAAAALDDLKLPNVRVVAGVVEPLSLLDAWSGAELAVVVDAAITTSSTPGRVRRCTLGDVVTAAEGLSSHSVDIGRTHALGQALGRVPGALVLYTVEVADMGHGIGLTPQVAAAVPEVVGMAVVEIKRWPGIKGEWGPVTRLRRPASR